MKSDNFNDLKEWKVSPAGDEVCKSQILLLGGDIVNETQITKGDLLIDNGIIKQINKHIQRKDENIRIIDCDGKYIIPGGIDVNTHFLGKSKNVTSYEDFKSGSMEALLGGTTFIINVTNPEESSKNLLSEFNYMKEMAKSQSCCDYSFIVTIRNFNEDISSQMRVLVNEHGVNTFKISLRDNTSNLHDDDVAYDFFKFCKSLGILLLVNAGNGKLYNKNAINMFENGITGPQGHQYSCNDEIESASIVRLISISEETNCPLMFMNIMSSATSNIIAKAKNKSNLIFGETICPSLVLNGLNCKEKSWPHAVAFITDPPLTNDIYGAENLMKDISSGCIDVVGSNHCRFTTGQRQIGLKDFRRIPFGIPGVSERMMIVWEKGVNSGILDVRQFVSATSTNAAKLFNLYPKKGVLKVGSDADIVIWDPNIIKSVSKESHDSNEYNIYKNIQSHGTPAIVISNGIVTVENSIVNVNQGCGKYFKIEPNNCFIYRHVALKDKILSQKYKLIQRDNSTTDSKEELKIDELNINDTNNYDGTMKTSHRPTTRCGGRNMQDSTFSLSGAQVDDNKPVRPGIRSQQPPGGVSTNLW